MATIPTTTPQAGPHQNNNQALTVLTNLFFMMDFITCMNDILVPHLKEVFSLNYAQALLVQFCFFTAYVITSIPFGKFISRLGYKNGVIGGFLIATTGCLLFYPAAGSKSYPIFLGALFILASGVTLLHKDLWSIDASPEVQEAIEKSAKLCADLDHEVVEDCCLEMKSLYPRLLQVR